MNSTEKLKEFAREIIEDFCWGSDAPDSGDVQELAESLVLIETHNITEKDIESGFDGYIESKYDDYVVGDEIFRFTDILLD